MIERIPTAGMSREDWLLERRKSIGGSDAGAILGLNPYRSPYAVWAEKTGRLPEREDNEAMRQGRDLEAYVAQRFMEKSGKRVERYNYLLRSSEAPRLHASIDRRVIGERSGLECKTASALSMRSYAGGQFPESYYVQCVAYLAVTGWERWYLAALVLNKAFFIYQLTTLPNDEKPEWCESSVFVPRQEIDGLKACISDFWESCVAADVPPAADGTDSTGETLRTIYPGGEDGEIDLFGREKDLEQYFILAGEKKGIERDMERIRQTIMEDMGDTQRASCGSFRISWPVQERRSFDQKAFRKRHPGIDISDCYKTTAMRPMKITEVK